MTPKWLAVPLLAAVVTACDGSGGDCQEGALRCVGGAVSQCRSGAWVLAELCPEGCLDGQCFTPSADGDGDLDVDHRADGESRPDADVATGVLVVAQRWAVPRFATGAPSVHTDLFVSAEPKLYLVNDQQDCEVTLDSDGAPQWEASSGTFCALTPGYILRGWTWHSQRDHIVDAEGMQIVSGSGSRWRLPPELSTPTGLTDDGTHLIVADSSRQALSLFVPGEGEVATVPVPATGVRGVTWDGASLWVLYGDRVAVVSTSGAVVRELALTEDLSGICWTASGVYATTSSTAEVLLLREG